jgi:hypothetical protein
VIGENVGANTGLVIRFGAGLSSASFKHRTIANPGEMGEQLIASFYPMPMGPYRAVSDKNHRHNQYVIIVDYPFMPSL